jgi:hypothetical protein
LDQNYPNQQDRGQNKKNSKDSAHEFLPSLFETMAILIETSCFYPIKLLNPTCFHLGVA